MIMLNFYFGGESYPQDKAQAGLGEACTHHPADLPFTPKKPNLRLRDELAS
jgi:hypothetical protein